MKRWQDRGEVQDSDDEDLSLGGDGESQSPQQARKKLRLNEYYGSGDGTGQLNGADDLDAGANEDADVPWLAPAIATGYGKKARPTKPSAASTPRREALFVAIPSGPPTVNAERHYGRSANPSSSVKSDELPDPSQFIRGRKDTMPVTPVQLSNALDSFHSSPLSELGATPRSPAQQHGHAEVTQLATGPVASSVRSPSRTLFANDHPLTELAELLDGQQIVNNDGGRTFRARTEKQLHPYGWDKTLYQQQWKQRGLKPIQVVDQRAAETQDQSYSNDESDSQQQPFFSSSPARASPMPDGAASAADSRDLPNLDVEDDFPDIDTILRKPIPGAVNTGRKRRKTAHDPDDVTNPRAHSVLSGGAVGNTRSQDVYSIPPSPPPTSSDSQQLPKQDARRPVFRLPHGATPAPLPTPQVSSDVHRHRPTVNDDYDLDDILPSRASRPSTISRVRIRPLIIDSSTESEGDQDPETNDMEEPEVDERRLLRERKRIKGVLPASWLKIDFKAQRRQRSPTPTRMRRASTPPTAELGRLKGVAQRVSKISSTGRQQQALVISEDEDEVANSAISDNEGSRPHGADTEQPWSALLRPDADDPRMEGDWVDPMLAGASRNTATQRRQKHRQARIADAFLRAGGGASDVREERTSSRRVKSSNIKTSTGSRRTTAQPGSNRRSRAPRLSILDMPSLSPTLAAPVPQFIRLAQRQAQRQTAHGRHSPKSKIIRLATAEDTADAETTLVAWREGTITPRDLPPSAIDTPLQATEVLPTGKDLMSGRSRLHLTDLTNYQQSLLPSPLGITPRNISTDGGFAQTQPSGRKRQTQLQTVTVQRRDRQGSGARREQPEDQQIPPAQGRQRTHRPTARNARYRGGQLESLERAYYQEHRAAAFERRIAALTETIVSGRQTTQQPMGIVEHYLHSEMPQQPEWSPRSSLQVDGTHNGPRPNRPSRPGTHRLRKRQPKHVDTEARQFRQPSEPLPDNSVVEAANPAINVVTENAPALKGLGPFGTRYATDFDVRPLPLGTFFHASTFIGSGDFAASLKLAQRDLSAITGRIHIHVADNILVWEAWTEEVAAGLTEISKTIIEAVQSLDSTVNDDNAAINIVSANIDHMLRSVIRYISKCLAFSDAIDRRSCLQRLHHFVEHMLENAGCWPRDNSDLSNIGTLVRQYLLVVAHLACQLSNHDLVLLDARQACRKLLERTANDLAHTSFPAGFKELRSFYEDSRSSSKREAGVRDDVSPMSTIILLRYCLASDQPGQPNAWSTLFSIVQSKANTLDSVSALDCAWYDLFTLLPALELDDTGVAVPGQRFSNNEHDWTLPKALLSRLLDLYPAASAAASIGINDYLQATLSRCFIIIDRWCWWRCEGMLGVMFDFFARRSLGPLPREHHSGSPPFLQELDNHHMPDLQPSDRPYHIFLKTIVTGLKHMQKPGRYTDKKIGGIVWRFIPSHGRTYPKDADVQEADIEALRNHQDLLCTLYYAAPSGHRPRVELLRHLVDHAQSHREACRLNVRAWANLIRFQVSCGEPDEAMLPFLAWYRDVTQATMAQFRLARTEAETDYAAACAQGNTSITQTTLESIIATNQRRIVATLVDALAGLTGALLTAKTISAVTTLVQGTAFWDVLTPFDTTEKRLLPALDEALLVVKAILDAQQALAATKESQNTTEDSQDFGDSSALEELMACDETSNTTSPHFAIYDILHDPVKQLMSTVFGADVALDDHIMGRIVDTWVRLAGVAVAGSQGSWADFVGEYHADSWQQLRSTEQRRKFTPYFYARVVESSMISIEVFDESLGVLLVSLVEREATLKFQHLLLNALLNHVPGHPVLDNLPFTRDARGSMFNIGLLDLRQRRLALLSCMLSNMRQHFDSTLYERPSQVQSVRKQYATFLRQLMQAMKTNFMELQGGSDTGVADPHASGAYVEFVQHVVSYLQQYTTDICRVDDFFTDSSAFPLPATDPTYVVGRLRSYAPKLRDPKARKELTVFVQTVVERAVVDGHQSYLLDQLCTAMDTGVERGSETAPSLRLVLLTAILSLYLDTALDTACSWMLSSPILTVYGTVAGSLMYNLDLQDQNSIQAVVQITSTMLRSVQSLLQQALTHCGLLTLPHVQRVLVLAFDNARQIQTLCAYLRRRNASDDRLPCAIVEVHKGAVEVLARLTGSDDEWYGFEPSVTGARCCWWADTSDFASRQLRKSLGNSWHARDGQYFVQRGKTMKEVVVSLDNEDNEKEALATAIRSFCHGFEAVTGSSQNGSKPIRGAKCTTTLVV